MTDVVANSGASATSCATTASTTATTSSRSPTCCSSRWPTSAASSCPRRPTGRTSASRAAPTLLDALRRGPRARSARSAASSATSSPVRRAASATPVNLKKLIGLIDETEWTSPRRRREGRRLRGLLEKAASEGKKGAGQYFTPRRSSSHGPLHEARPAGDKRLHDRRPGLRHRRLPGGGLRVAQGQTGGGRFDRETAKRVRSETYFGQELVARPRRLALMNLYLHQVEPHITLGDSIYEPPSSAAVRRGPDQPALRHQGREPGPRTATTSPSRPRTSSSTSSSTS